MSKKDNRQTIIGITMGDPAGVGAEIILKALADRKLSCSANFVVYGSPEVMQLNATMLHSKIQIQPVTSIHECRFPENSIEVIDCSEGYWKDVSFGRVAAENGELAYQSIIRAIDDAMGNRIDATVTAPINKESLQKAGHKFAGHTEIFAHFTHTKNYTMLLQEGAFRVAHVSTHVSLKQAIELVTKERIVQVIKLVHDALTHSGIKKPRIAVAGLNPHAGENGLFGNEELEHIIPAIEMTHELGARGPFPPDSVFCRALGGEFDCVIAMYHDQGHIPLKMEGFRYSREQSASINGINITLGTPIIRCSVDHGTAFDIAGKGIADEGSMVSAIEMAVQQARID